jgi:hypothetical protein
MSAISCAQESRMSGENLAGTFKPVDTFFLLESHLTEYGGWGGEIVKRAGASGALAPILRHLGQVPRSKTLFIRRPGAAGSNFFVALTNLARPRIYHAVLSDYDELLTLEIELDAEDRPPRVAGRALDEIDVLYAVCTNGRHDPCCAAQGMPVYQALVECAGAKAVWQTSHLGGHRLAATMIAFPQGIAYGHLDPLDAEAIVTNHRAGSLLLHKLRGRGAYVGHALEADAHQAACAAEVKLRESQGLYALDDVRLLEVVALDHDCHLVRFETATGLSHELQVRTTLSAPRQTSCGDAPKPMPQHQILASSAAL